jgi:hypothetical protein
MLPPISLRRIGEIAGCGAVALMLAFGAGLGSSLALLLLLLIAVCGIVRARLNRASIGACLTNATADEEAQDGARFARAFYLTRSQLNSWR